MPDSLIGDTTPCLICGVDGPLLPWEPPNQPRYDCAICGKYRLSERAARPLQTFAYGYGASERGRVNLASDHHLLSAVLRERFEGLGGVEVYVPDFEELRAAARPLSGGPLEAADRVLQYVADHAEFVGAPVSLLPHRDYPIAYARNHGEFTNVVRQIAVPLGYVDADGEDPLVVRVTASGWRRLYELRAQRRGGRQAFVAMWFDPTMEAAYSDGIAPALRACGYRPLRIDREEHNEKIDDRIVAAIRRSALIVADFTGNRGGVYFEAGFAMGLGVPLVWSCRADAIAHVHFDTRQYSHVLWQTPDELRRKLQARIEATLPTFPHVAEDRGAD